MKISEVLNKAADLIEQRGWRTGGWGTEGEAAPLCLEGGILAAIGLRWGGGAAAVSLWSCPAYAAVQTHLGLRPIADEHRGPERVEDGLWHWNDDSDRTASEVIEVLRATAVIEAAREDARVEVSA